jgi:hypothetical protein
MYIMFFVVLNSVFAVIKFFSSGSLEIGVRFDRSVSNYVWCEHESDCNDLISASASDSGSDFAKIASAVIVSKALLSASASNSGSGSDNATIASAVIVSTVARIQGLQQQPSGAELRIQDQVERSNPQTVTLRILIHSYVRYACVNVVWMRCINHPTAQHLEQPSGDKPKVGPGCPGASNVATSRDRNLRLVACVVTNGGVKVH